MMCLTTWRLEVVVGRTRGLTKARLPQRRSSGGLATGVLMRLREMSIGP
jgi:hypothetical protein